MFLSEWLKVMKYSTVLLAITLKIIDECWSLGFYLQQIMKFKDNR